MIWLALGPSLKGDITAIALKNAVERVRGSGVRKWENSLVVNEPCVILATVVSSAKLRLLQAKFLVSEIGGQTTL